MTVRSLCADAGGSVDVWALAASARADFRGHGLRRFGDEHRRDAKRPGRCAPGLHYEDRLCHGRAQWLDRSGRRCQGCRCRLPPGLVGNPAGVPTCTPDQLSNNGGTWLTAAVCPVDSQVGVADIDVAIFGPVPAQVGVYNIEAPRGAPALLGFNVLGTVVLLEPELRGNDYGLNVHVTDTSQTLTVMSSKITLWGVPADPGRTIRSDGSTSPRVIRRVCR